MPFVSGFLKVRKRRPGSPGHPDNELPGIEGPVDPDYGVDEGAGIDNELPSPPPGIWPPLTPEHPWLKPDHPIALPPGTVWPPLPPGVSGKYLALVLIGGGGHGAHYRYVVIDADARPDNELPEGGEHPSHPIAPGGVPTPRGR
jgi:hypothetical protein